MGRQTALTELLRQADSRSASAVVIDFEGGGQVSLARETAQVVPVAVGLSMMQDLARQAIGETPRSEAVAELATDQAVAMHRVYEMAMTGVLLAGDTGERLSFMNSVIGYVNGWGDGAGLESLFTSGLSLLGPDVGPAAMMGAGLTWDQFVKDGSFPNEFGAIVAGSDSATVSFLGPGGMQQLGLSPDFVEAMHGLDLGPGGFGPRLETFGFGPGSPVSGPLEALGSGYPSGYFDQGFTPGTLCGTDFVPFGDGSSAPAPGPSVTGMMGSNGFVPGAFLPMDGGTGFYPGGVGSAAVPGTGGSDGGHLGGGCPIDESYLSESIGQSVHSLAQYGQAAGMAMASAGLAEIGFGTSAVLFGASVSLIPGGAVVGAPILEGGAALTTVGIFGVAAGGAIHVTASMVELVTRPDPPSTTGATPPSTPGTPPSHPPTGGRTPTPPSSTGGHPPAGAHPPTGGTGSGPHPKDEEEFDAYVHDAIGLPASFKGVFPDVGCPDPFSGGLWAPSSEESVYQTTWLPQVSEEMVALVELAAPERDVVRVRPFDPGVVKRWRDFGRMELLDITTGLPAERLTGKVMIRVPLDEPVDRTLVMVQDPATGAWVPA